MSDAGVDPYATYETSDETLDDQKAKARLAGYNWDEIDNHLQQKTNTALAAGYTQDEIDRHLGYAEPPPLGHQPQWASTLAADPSILDKFASDPASLDLTASPTWRQDYATALSTGTAKGPRDFALGYAADFMSAAHDLMGLDVPDDGVANARQVAGSFAADALATQLPHPNEVIDSALAVGGALNQVTQLKRELPGPGYISGELHLDEGLAPKVPEGAARPFAPGESIRNPDGSWSSEESMTVSGDDSFNDGKPTVIPSLWLKDGRAYVAHDEDEAVDLAKASGLTFPSFNNMDEAEAYSQQREQQWQGMTPTGAALVSPLYDRKAALLDHWAQTGESPNDAAIRASQQDATFLQPTPPEPGLWDRLNSAYSTANEVGAPFADQVSPVLADQLGQWLVQHFMAVAKDQGDWARTQQAIADRLQGKPLAEQVLDPERMEAAYNAAFVLMPANIGGPLGEFVGKMPEPKVPAVDLTKPPGEAITEWDMAQALEAPKAAARQPVPTPAEGETAPTEPQPFAETAKPSEKIEALAQEAGETRQSFADMAKNEDQPTQDLARGNDTTAKVAKWMNDVYGEDIAGGGGGGGGGRPPEPPPAPGEPGAEIPSGTRAARILGKNTADSLIRWQSTGLLTQKTEHIAQQFEQFFSDLSPYLPRWRNELAKPYSGGAMDTEIGQMLNAIEGKGVVAPDSPLAPYVRFRAEQNDRIIQAINEAVAREELNPVQFRDNYIAHLYTPESVYGSRGAAVSAGRTGNLGWTRERTIPTYEDALREGFKPRYDNPILLDLASIDAKLKALTTLRMQKMARDSNWMRYYMSDREALRDGFKPVDGIGSEKVASVVKPDGTPDFPVTQRLYAKEGFDRIWNNWVGFDAARRSEVAATVEDAMLKLKNGSTYLKLMFPGYHTVTEYKNGMANGIANALDELRGGEIARGVWDLARVPIKPIENIYQAQTRWRPMYRAMEADPALDAFIGGGGSLAPRSKVYAASDQPTLWRLWNRGQLGQDLLDDMKKGLTFPETRATGSMRGVATDLGNALTLPFREIARVTTSITAPVWDHMIPLLKGGAAIERIQTFIRQNPTASDDVVRAYARDVVTNIEDRFGEYNSANLFWRPMVKRAANQTMLSTGWTYGTVHAVMQGLGWDVGRGFRWNPVATTNLAAQLATVAFTNAAWTLAIDSKMPDSTLDYLLPFANARGLARILLPGEEKEYWDWAKIAAESYSVGKDKGLGSGFQQFWQAGKDYALGKLAPIWQAAKTFLTGEDAIGHKIAYAPGGIGGFLRDQFLPIFAQNWNKNAQVGISPVGTLFGLREGPKWAKNWDAWRASQEKLHNMWTKQELSRAGKEAIAAGEEPPEGYQFPRGRGGGGRSGVGGGAREGGITPQEFQYGRSGGITPQEFQYGGVQGSRRGSAGGGSPYYYGGVQGGGAPRRGSGGVSPVAPGRQSYQRRSTGGRRR